MQLLDKMNVVNKNPSYLETNKNLFGGKKVTITNIPIERIKLLDAVGEGAFGQVFKGTFKQEKLLVRCDIWPNFLDIIVVCDRRYLHDYYLCLS